MTWALLKATIARSPKACSKRARILMELFVLLFMELSQNGPSNNGPSQCGHILTDLDGEIPSVNLQRKRASGARVCECVCAIRSTVQPTPSTSHHVPLYPSFLRAE